MRFKIGYLSTFYHTSILLMAKDKIGSIMGLEVEWKLFGTGPTLVNAFEKDEINLAYMGLPPAIIGIDRGVPIKCIAGGHVEGTVISGRSEFSGFPEIQELGEILKQFIGHKIGVPGKGSIHDVIISECLNRFDLNGKIEVLNFYWADQIIDAMYKGEVLAAVGTPALAIAVKRFIDGRILYPPSKLWPNNPSYGILINSNFLKKESEALEQFLILHEEATSFLRNKPIEAAEIISGYIGLVDREFVLNTLGISPKYCAQITNEYISVTMEFVRVLKKLGYISREILSDEIFDISLIRKIHSLKDHYGEGVSEQI